MKCSIDGMGDINVVRAGPAVGVPVVLLHPVGLDLTWWSAQIEALSGRFHVVAIDMPDHGMSGPMQGLPTFDRLAGAVESVMAQLELAPAHIIGLSIGGMIAQALALRAPGRVRSLVLAGTACTMPDPVRAALHERARVAREQGMETIAELSIERWFTSDFRHARPDVMDRARATLLRRDADFHGAIWDMIAELSMEEQIGAIGCPVLIVTGEDDVNCPPPVARQIQQAIPNACLELMAGTGHFPPFERPDAFNRLVGGFLGEH